jgi:hypothetical protein
MLAMAAVAACTPQGGQPGTHGAARGFDCRVDVRTTPPSSGYVELGQLSFEAYAAGPARRQYTSPYALAAAIHDDICAIGGDTLVTEQNAAGVIVRGTVLRRADVLDIPDLPAQPPSRTERCEPGCGPGLACEGGTCVPQCAPACGDGEVCGDDRICRPGA